MMQLLPFPNRSARNCCWAWPGHAGARLKKRRGCTKPLIFLLAGDGFQRRTALAAPPAVAKLLLPPVLSACTATGVLIKSP